MYSGDTLSINSSILSSLYSTNKSSASEETDQVPPTKICLIGRGHDSTALLAVSSFNLDVVTSETGDEYLDDPSVILVLEDFQGPIFEKVQHLKWRVLGLPALILFADRMQPLPRVRRPLLSLVMKGVVTCFNGLRDRQMAVQLMFQVRSMGGSVRGEPSSQTTHLVSCTTSGRKYTYAVTFLIPIMSFEWIRACWEHRLSHCTRATDDALMVHRLKPFLDVFACFVGFPQNELDEAANFLTRCGGVLVSPKDPRCTHIVADDLSPVCIPAGIPASVRVVTADWFWTSIQHVTREPESEFQVPTERFRRPPQRSSLRRRLPQQQDILERECPSGADVQAEEDDEQVLKFPRVDARFHSRWRRPSCASLDEAATLPRTPLEQADAPESPSTPDIFLSARKCHRDGETGSAAARRGSQTGSAAARRGSQTSSAAARRGSQTSSAAVRRGSERSNASSASSQSQAYPVSARFGAFSELLQTEENYVAILNTILQMGTEAVDVCQAGGPLLSQTEAKIIFGALMPIARTHRVILKDLRAIYNNWTEDANIGQVYTEHSPSLLRDYAPFVSTFEESRSTISQACERSPRFGAFLKMCRGRPECGRQELHELMIRPVQRLGSCKLLLREILKHTREDFPDRKRLELALESLSEVLDLINEDKRKMELLSQVFDVFKVVENCPADLIASHRSLIVHFEGVELAAPGFRKQGDHICIFVFTDVMMVCKKKSKAVSLAKKEYGYMNIPQRVMKALNGKPYKFLEVLPLSCIRKIVDVACEERSPSVLGVIFRLKSQMRESSSYLRLVDLPDGSANKSQLLDRWSCALATHNCVADPNHFVQRQTLEESSISPELLLKRKATLVAATQAFVQSAFSLGKPSTSATGLPCAMSSFNSTSQLETLKSASQKEDEDDDVFEGPQTSSLTATIMKRL